MHEIKNFANWIIEKYKEKSVTPLIENGNKNEI